MKGDNVTVVRRPRFTGVARYTDNSAAANVTVELATTDGRLLALATTSSTGAFTLSLPNDLTNGKISVFARIRDVAGNPGPNSQVINLVVTSVAGDLNGDGLADLDGFNRSTSRFTLTTIANPGGTSTTAAAPFLTATGDVPLQGDFDSDGKMDYGFYRPSSAQWFIRQSQRGNALVNFGTANVSLPVQADFDGDGQTDFAHFTPSGPSAGSWTVFQSRTGTLRTVSFGASGDQPIPADFDGDGKADFAVYRPGTSQFFASFSSGTAVNTSTAGNRAFDNPSAAIPVFNTAFGNPGTDVPVVADYDGDGKVDVGVYRTNTSQWFLKYANGSLQGVAFGNVGTDIPVPADYDGDGKADLALFRSTNANWLILGSSTPGRIVASGSAGDVPLVAPLQPYRVQTRTVGAKSVLGASSASDFSANPAGSVDLGGTARKFSSASGASRSAASVVRKAPAQASAPVVTRFGHPDVPLGPAALERLGRLTLRRKKR